LLEGLEITEVKLSKTYENKDFRIDTDFHTKPLIINQKIKYEKIGNILLNSQYGISIEMNEVGVGIPIYRMNEIHNMLCDSNVSKCAEITNTELETFRLKDRDVLFNRTNSYEWVGRTGLYRKKGNENYIFASYLVRFNPDENFIFSEYLTTFLSCKYGIWDIKRRARHSINQTNVNPEEVKEIEIPLLSLYFQKLIKNCFDISYNNIVLAETLYAAAEQRLLELLGLSEWQAGEKNTTEKSFSSSFGVSGRLDAEYYQPKYDEIENKIKSYEKGFELFSNIIATKDDIYSLTENKEYKYIELSDIGNSGEITGSTIDLGKNLPSRARRLVKTGDVIISSIEGSLTKCAIITPDYDNSLCSTGFYVLKSNDILPEILLLLFKSNSYQELLKGRCNGTILTAISKDELKTIPIPILPIEEQEKLKAQIQESFKLRQESSRLIELAKQAVEIAIEKDEAAGIAFLEGEMKM